MLAFLPSLAEAIVINLILFGAIVALIVCFVVKPIVKAITSRNNVDVASQIEKLSILLEKGYLTREEFDEQKRKLLF